MAASSSGRRRGTRWSKVRKSSYGDVSLERLKALGAKQVWRVIHLPPLDDFLDFVQHRHVFDGVTVDNVYIGVFANRDGAQSLIDIQQIVGHNATKLLHELLLARHCELLPEDVESMIHAHPSISEAIMEAMRCVNGKPVHG